MNAPARIRDRVTQSVHDIRQRAPERRVLVVRGACVLAVAAGAAVGLRWVLGRR
ncbi:MAG TPA: hypothetical protein VLB81_10470 [Gaiellales bacterium]|nr:hypothetical protein [Gaiellales bacterium]